MFVNVHNRPRSHTYYRSDGAQCASKGAYLILATAEAFGDPSEDENGSPVLYACVRTVALSQLGHFMMGYARIAGASIVVSGAYGSDSLPIGEYKNLAPGSRRFFTRVSPDLARIYWNSRDGGNTAQAIENETRAT